MDNISCCNLDNGNLLREVMVNIGLERIDIQEEVIVEALLDSVIRQECGQTLGLGLGQ